MSRRQTKRLAASLPERGSPSAPGPSTPHGWEAPQRPLPPLLALPDAVLHRQILEKLEFKELCALAQSAASLNAPASDGALWRSEWERMYGPAAPLQEAAAARAGSWKALFAARHAALKESDPWLKPSSFEVEASVEALVALPPPAAGEPGGGDAAGSSAAPPPPPPPPLLVPEAAEEGEAAGQEIQPEQPPPEMCLMFLVDGSGSVTEEDFRVMTGFMAQSVRALAAAPHGPRSHVSVLQFSNDVRVEQAPAPVDPEQFEAMVEGMHRIAGGTNITLAMAKAGQLLKPLGPHAARVLVLLTDGRIDSHQSREAAEMAARLADEQARVRLHAYGVGRGVDKEELLRIIAGVSATGGAAKERVDAEERYLSLMVLDEAPW